MAGLRRADYEAYEEFFELVSSGMSVMSAASATGVVRTSSQYWWRVSGLVDRHMQVGRTGGLAGSPPPRDPGDPSLAGRRRRPLTSEDRAVIAAGIRGGWSYARIGAAIGRDKSVIYREVIRNRGVNGTYWGAVAHRAAHERRRRPKQFRLVENPGLCRRIEEWMDQGWSPRLIARVLKDESPRACQILCVRA